MPAVGQYRTMPWPAYLIARAWMRRGAFRDQGERLAELLTTFAQNTGQLALLSHVIRDRAASRVKRCGGDLAAGIGLELALWHPGGYYFGANSSIGTWPGWWVERDGMIVHWTGPEVSPLFFDYPLEGTFEISVDGYDDAWAESAVEWGRALFEPFSSAGSAQLRLIGEQESVQRTNANVRRGRFNRMVIHVRPEKVSYLCNGSPVLEYLDP